MAMPSISMPSISSPESPAMPKISAPTLGTKFYTPGTQTNISNKNATEGSQTQVNSAKKSSETSASSLTNEKSSSTTLSASNIINHLTASDIATLGSDGLFGGIYSILGNESAISNQYASNNSNDVLLKSVLSELEELKQKTEQNTEAVKKISLPITTSGTQETQSSKHEFNPAILRFLVNGYNIKDTIRTTYFSKKENDGSFLLTGDRKFTTNGKNREETFYLLFKSDGNCGTSAGYFVEPEVVQDYKNEYSFLYQLTQKPDLKAEKTGNLVSLKYVSDTWNMDLLIDIGDE